jgi:hypothetical protein
MAVSGCLGCVYVEGRGRGGQDSSSDLSTFPQVPYGSGCSTGIIPHDDSYSILVAHARGGGGGGTTTSSSSSTTPTTTDSYKHQRDTPWALVTLCASLCMWCVESSMLLQAKTFSACGGRQGAGAISSRLFTITP